MSDQLFNINTLIYCSLLALNTIRRKVGIFQQFLIIILVIFQFKIGMPINVFILIFRILDSTKYLFGISFQQ